MGHAALSLRKPQRPLIFLSSAAKRTPTESNDSDPTSDPKSQMAHRPRKLAVRRASEQDERRPSSAHQAALGPKRFVRQVHQQTLSIHDLRHPSHITAYTKQQKEAAISLARAGRPEAALIGFCDSMDALFSAVGFIMNCINYAAIVTALAHVWEAARRNDRFKSHAGVRDRIEALYQRCVQSLQTLLADMHAQGLSTVLWSSAKLGFDPDAVVPGMTHNLSLRLLKLIDVSEEKQRPNAQACANLVWALATMGHPAATSEVVDPVCWRFASLTRHADTRQRPTAQATANVLWALATMGHPAAAEMVNAVSLHFARLTQHADTKQRPNAQAAANTLWALATMRHSAATAEVVDSVTMRFAHIIDSPNAKQQPTAQNVANVVWALGTLKHTPDDDRLLGLFCACMHTMLQSQPPIAARQQLHQALAWLKPAPGSQPMEAWSSLRSGLQAVAPEPDFVPTAFTGQAEVSAALEVQALPHKAQVPYGTYWAHAVLSSSNSNDVKVFLMVERPQDFITNVPSRVLGHVSFRHQMLGRNGTVVTVPYDPDHSSVQSMAGDIKAAVEAKTGLPLDSFRS
ncbi:hypothetical protein ABBQ38_013654 [Trebouxia sp. C0009 RCD-2024]